MASKGVDMASNTLQNKLQNTQTFKWDEKTETQNFSNQADFSLRTAKRKNANSLIVLILSQAMINRNAETLRASHRLAVDGSLKSENRQKMQISEN